MNQIIDEGLVRGRELQRYLRFGSEERVVCTEVRSLPILPNSRENVLIVPGPRIISKLDKNKAAQLREFSRDVSNKGKDALRSHKQYVLELFDGHTPNNEILAVPWRLGGIPVLEIGRINGQRVCATPLNRNSHLKTNAKLKQDPINSPSLFDQEFIKEKNVVEKAILLFFNECAESYLDLIADLLRSAFFRQDRKYLIPTLEEIELHLGSIEHKIKILNKESLLEEISDSGILERGLPDFDFYRAIVHLIRTIMDSIRYSVMLTNIDKQQNMLHELLSMIDSYSEDNERKQFLEECYYFLNESREHNKLSPLARSDFSFSWMKTLLECCHFISHVMSLLRECPHGPDTVFIFVTYHMNVYASEDFQNQFELFVNKENKGRVKVWTGRGRQENIFMSIMAKLWLSDVHVLYLPNSLDTYEGSRKEITLEQDWVIKELIYGNNIGIPFHCVIATGKNFNGFSVAELLLNSIRAFKLSSNNPLIEKGLSADIGLELCDKINSHLDEIPFTLHSPMARHISNDDQRLLRTAVVNSAIKGRFKRICKNVQQLVSNPDHRMVAFSLFNSSLKQGKRKRLLEVNTDEIWNVCSKMKRTDKKAITRDWLQRILREYLKNVEIWINGSRFSLVEIIKNGNKNLYIYGFNHLDTEYAKFHELPEITENTKKPFSQ
tara:strand:+ start:1020 stop:3017 length:1998 start_codon:yes stop_codon:yes gene_type:complete